MMIRSFLPVGQGAFYLEHFKINDEHIKVIYDCGSSTDVKIVEKEIRNNFTQDEEIAAVFISHLDRDHTNGLPYLLKYCRVEKIFLPLITQESQKYILLKDLISYTPATSSFFAEFVSNPEKAIKEILNNDCPSIFKINEVLPEEANGIPENDNERIISSGKNVADKIFISKILTKINWCYIPFNFRETQRIKELKKSLKIVLGKDYTWDELSELVKKSPEKLNDIKKAFKEIPGSPNTNSMTLLSASIDEYSRQNSFLETYMSQIYCRFHHAFCQFDFASGCLYTGDYDASGIENWNRLEKAYRKYYNYIGCVQIPHHGSRHNYNSNLLTLGNFIYYIISAGEKSQYRHPHGSVIRDILLNHKYPIIVTEHSGNVARFIINFY